MKKIIIVILCLIGFAVIVFQQFALYWNDSLDVSEPEELYRSVNYSYKGNDLCVIITDLNPDSYSLCTCNISFVLSKDDNKAQKFMITETTLSRKKEPIIDVDFSEINTVILISDDHKLHKYTFSTADIVNNCILLEKKKNAE